MNLRIATILPAIISFLVVMGVATSGYNAYRAYENRQDAEAFLKTNQISQLLLRSAGQWAIGRGITNAALKSPDVPSPDRRAELAKTRAQADQYFREAALRLREIPAMRTAQQRVTEAESALQAFQGVRSQVEKPLRNRVPNATRRLSTALRLPLPS